MFKYLMLWYRAKTYCPVIDSLRNEPDMWVDRNAYDSYIYKKTGKSSYKYRDSFSIFHKDLDIEITNWDYSSDLYKKVAKRNGHSLPVSSKKLQREKRKMDCNNKLKALEKARAEMNRITQDAQTLRVARIAQLRKELADQEAADFAYRLEHAG